jgi:preprotein translocase subunit YajC
MNDNETIRTGSRWCILRTGGPQTLKLVAALNSRGIPAWTPTATVRRKRPGNRHKILPLPKSIELSAPIVPTFAFAPASALNELLAIRGEPINGLPPFSVLRIGERTAFVRDRGLRALRDEEDGAAARYAALIQAEAEAKTAEEAKRARVALLRNEQARRKALREVRREFEPGDSVTVSKASGFAGMTGVVRSGDGKSFMIRFGGALEIKIEAWQLDAVSIDDSVSPAE